MSDLLILTALFLLLNPTASFAYLDPSAGNALVYIAVTMISVVIYVAKGVFYKILGKNTEKYAEAVNDIAIFSEGKNYWTTFEPIIQALLAKKQAFSYYTMDVEDPGLKIRSNLVHNRYLGGGCPSLCKTK